MDTFTWIPEFGGSGPEQPSVSTVKFGEGYESRMATGINSQPRTFNLTFANRDQTEANEILTFLRNQNGVSAFLWTPPFESTALVWKCASWTPTFLKANLYTITATFNQVFEP